MEDTMKEFVFVFHKDHQVTEVPFSAEKDQIHLKDWQDWFRSLAAQDKLAIPIQFWEPQGKVLKPDHVVTEGPYMEMKKSFDGLIVVKANDYIEAREIANECPVLELGGTVEIRMVN